MFVLFGDQSFNPLTLSLPLARDGDKIMAQYQHLPIYKATYELLRLVTNATSNFAKSYKYSLGDKLRSEVAVTLHRAGYGAAVPSRLSNARFPF